MQPMIGRDAVLLLINHRIGSLRNELRLGNCNMTAINAQIACLEDIKHQIDFIQPVSLDAKVLVTEVEVPVNRMPLQA